MVPGVGIGEEEQIAARDPVALDDRPRLAEPPAREVRPAHQAQPALRLGRLRQPLHDLRRGVARAVVDDDHFDGPVRRREDGAHARCDVPALVACRDDHRDERAARLGLVLAEPGAAGEVAADQQPEEQGVPRGDEPRHSSFSPSRAAVTTAPVRVPMTLVMVRNMSGTRSRPRSSVSPASGSPVLANAGARLTMLADGTLATVSDARNTAAPAWNRSPSPSAAPPPYSRATNTRATAWNSALPARPMLAPSGSTKLATVREMRRSFSAASSITGRLASEEVVEKPISSEARIARRNRHTRSRATNATAGRYTTA